MRPDACSDRCPNCGGSVDSACFLFCPHCGQETRAAVPTIGEFLQHWGGAYLSTEGALWRSLKMLLTKPGELTCQFLLGRRKHYVHPLRLYMTLSVILLLLAGVSAVVRPVSGSTSPDLAVAIRLAQPTAVVNLQGVEVGLRSGQSVCVRLPQWLCSAIQERIRDEPDEFLLSLRRANSQLVARWGVVMFLLMPAFAACVQLLYYDRRMPFGAHLVYVLHLHAFWACMLVLVLPGWSPLTGAALAAIAGYTLLAERRVYGGTWWSRLLRAVALSVVYAAMLAVVVPLAFLLTLLL